MKCDNCPAMWDDRDIMTECGCLIRGSGYGGEGEYCYRTPAKVKAQLEELIDYACGRIKRPEWVLQRFLHDLKSQMDTVECGLPGLPPLWQKKREVEDLPFGDEYCIEVKPLYGSTDMYYEKQHAYRQGYEDCESGKEYDEYYPKRKEDYSTKEDIAEWVME